VAATKHKLGQAAARIVCRNLATLSTPMILYSSLEKHSRGSGYLDSSALLREW